MDYNNYWAELYFLETKERDEREIWDQSELERRGKDVIHWDRHREGPH